MTTAKSNFSIDVRTILIVAMSLSTMSILRQKTGIQLAVSFITITLLFTTNIDKSAVSKLFNRLKRLIPVIASIALMQLLFRRGGETYFEFYYLKITEAGVFYSISVGLRIINLVLIAGLLFNISSSEYLIAFKTWKVPYEISFLITAVIRFIPDYYELFNQYRQTMLLRGIAVSKLSLKNKVKAMIVLIRSALIEALNGVTYRAISLDMKRFRLFPTRTYLYGKKLPVIDYVIQTTIVITTLLLLIFI